MIIGILKLDLRIPQATSLKDKRMVLQSVKDKVRRSFNVSVAELDNHDTWQRAAVGIAAIGRETGTVNILLDKVKNFITTMHHVAVADFEIEIL